MQKKLLPLIHTDETLILAVYGFLQATPFSRILLLINF